MIWPDTPRKTSITVENQPFEDVFPIKTRDFPLSSFDVLYTPTLKKSANVKINIWYPIHRDSSHPNN